MFRQLHGRPVMFLGTMKLGHSVHKFLGVCNECGADGVDAVPGGFAGGADGGFGAEMEVDCFVYSLGSFAGFGDDPFGCAVGAGDADWDDGFVECFDGFAPAGEFGDGVVSADVVRPVGELVCEGGALGCLLGGGQVVADLVFDGGFDEEGVVVAGAGGFEAAAAGAAVGSFGDGVFELHQEW